MKNIFAQRLKELMVRTKTTQVDLAKKLGITRQSVSSYLNLIHPIDVDQIIILSKFFNVSSDYLLGISDLREIIVGDKQEIINYEIYSDIINEIKNSSEQLGSIVNKLKGYLCIKTKGEKQWNIRKEK